MCGGSVHRKRPDQLMVMYTLEGASYYPCQRDEKWLNQFDVTMVRYYLKLYLLDPRCVYHLHIQVQLCV